MGEDLGKMNDIIPNLVVGISATVGLCGFIGLAITVSLRLLKGIKK